MPCKNSGQCVNEINGFSVSMVFVLLFLSLFIHAHVVLQYSNNQFKNFLYRFCFDEFFKYFMRDIFDLQCPAKNNLKIKMWMEKSAEWTLVQNFKIDSLIVWSFDLKFNFVNFLIYFIFLASANVHLHSQELSVNINRAWTSVSMKEYVYKMLWGK